jgi:hypothetical protein
MKHHNPARVAVRRGSTVLLASVALLAVGISLSMAIGAVDDSETPIQFNELCRQVPISTAQPHLGANRSASPPSSNILPM